MELKIINETENPLFNRKEIQLSLKADTTPSREEVVKIISEKFSIPAGNIKIKKISGKFGSKVFTVIANLYASEEKKDKIESKKKKESEIKIAEPETSDEGEIKEKNVDTDLTSPDKSGEQSKE